MKRITAFVLSALVVILCFGASLYASCMVTLGEFKALDLVIVIDKSGSMLDSDKDRLSPDAVNLLLSAIPMEKSRVGIVTFNTKPEKAEVDGTQGLIPLNDFNKLESLRNVVNKIEYKGRTGIGNALLAATEMLRDYSDDDHVKGIILFTDGVNDFGSNLVELANCNDNEAAALLWAKNENCPIYCVGYDYLSNDGMNSIDTEGMTRLQNISDSTGGKCVQIHNISEARGVFEEFLFDFIDVKHDKTNDKTFPGDGGEYHVEIPVTSSVAELDISIVGDKTLSVDGAELHLFDPIHAEVGLVNTGRVRFYVGKTAINIKVVMPRDGTWLLTFKGVISEDMIHISTLEHYKVNLTSEFVYPEGNPDGIAYSNQTIGIRTWLIQDEKDITDAFLYDSVKKAEATFKSRVDPQDVTTIPLERDGLAFTGNFTIPQDSYYDVIIHLEWEEFHREIKTEIASSNKPLYLIGDLKSVTVNKKKTVEINGIYQCVADDENDMITASVAGMTNPDVVDAVVDSDKLVITGKDSWFGLWTSTVLTLEYRDAQGNVEPLQVKVKCVDPVAITLLICGVLLIVVTVLLILYAVYARSHKLLGLAEVTEITEGTVDKGGTFTAKGFSLKWSPTPVAKTQSATQGANPHIHGNSSGNTLPMPGGSSGNTPPMPGGTSGSMPPMPGGTSGNTPPMPGGVQGNAPSVPGSVPGGGAAISSEEAAASAAFSDSQYKAVNFGGRKKHKLTVYSILDGFAKNYSNFIGQQRVANPQTPGAVRQRFEDIAPATKRMKLFGSLQGKHGAKLIVGRGLIGKSHRKLYIDKPHLSGTRAKLNYDNADVESRTFSFHVVTDDSADPQKAVRVTVYLHLANK